MEFFSFSFFFFSLYLFIHLLQFWFFKNKAFILVLSLVRLFCEKTKKKLKKLIKRNDRCASEMSGQEIFFLFFTSLSLFVFYL